jgi:hypothetical protein
MPWVGLRTLISLILRRSSWSDKFQFFLSRDYAAALATAVKKVLRNPIPEFSPENVPLSLADPLVD